MLVNWRYRERDSIIQSFDPRAWLIFFACFLASTLLFWDVRYLTFFLVIALIVVFRSGIPFREMRRAWLFIGGLFILFPPPTLPTRRGGGGGFSTKPPTPHPPGPCPFL